MYKNALAQNKGQSTVLIANGLIAASSSMRCMHCRLCSLCIPGLMTNLCSQGVCCAQCYHSTASAPFMYIGGSAASAYRLLPYWCHVWLEHVLHACRVCAVRAEEARGGQGGLLRCHRIRASACRGVSSPPVHRSKYCLNVTMSPLQMPGLEPWSPSAFNAQYLQTLEPWPSIHSSNEPTTHGQWPLIDSSNEPNPPRQ